MAYPMFGVGILTITPSTTPATPVRIGTVKDVSVSIKGSPVKLYGERSFPVDVAVGQREITGKGKFASFASGIVAAALSATESTGGKVPVIDEAGTPTTNAYTSGGGSNWFEDLGVIKVSTNLPMTRVADGTAQGTLTAGQYVIAPSTGVYTFATADSNPPVKISYLKTDAVNGKTAAMTNGLMGAGTAYGLNLGNTYRGKQWLLRLPAIVVPTLDLAFKSDGHGEADFTFEGFADSLGNVYYTHWSE